MDERPKLRINWRGIRLPKVLPVVSFLLVLQLNSLSWAQIYSDTDTMSIIGSTGYAGDTVSVQLNLINTFAVGGIQSRLAFDNYTFVADTVLLTSRAHMYDLFGNYFGEPGIASFFATSLHPIENYIPIGSGVVATLVLTIRNSSVPGVYPIIFEDSDSSTHENALSNIYGDSLIVPILVSGEIEVLPSASVGDDQALPQLFVMTQNYPNPFNSETEISFALDSPRQVRLTVFDILGQKVADLFSGEAPAGRVVAKWDGKGENGKNVNSGIYFYRLEDSGGKSVTKRMTLLK
jgi:hypothetical protein